MKIETQQQYLKFAKYEFWLDLSKDFRPSKANVVADTLSREERLNMMEIAKELSTELEKLMIEVQFPGSHKESFYQITFQ